MNTYINKRQTDVKSYINKNKGALGVELSKDFTLFKTKTQKKSKDPKKWHGGLLLQIHFVTG